MNIKKAEQKDPSSVDRGLVAMFLKMSPDERLLANDNMVRTILELRNAYKQGKTYEDLLEDTVEIEFRGHIIRRLIIIFAFFMARYFAKLIRIHVIVESA
jgi:hypothetical protein